MGKNKLYVGTHFNIERNILTIGAIETEILKALKKYQGKNVLLMVSKEINSLCEINIGYDAVGFGIFKMQVDNKLSAKEFVLTELENKLTQSGRSEK